MGSRTLWEETVRRVDSDAGAETQYLIRSNIKTWMETYSLIIWPPSCFIFPGEYSAVRTVGVNIGKRRNCRGNTRSCYTDQ